MTDLAPNQTIYIAPGVLAGIEGLLRILWFDEGLDQILLIPVDQSKRQGPQRKPLTAVQGIAQHAPYRPDPRALMSDEELAQRYPRKTKSGDSFPVAYRTYWWSVIQPIIAEAHRYFSTEVSLNTIIRPRAAALGISARLIYEVVYRYWAAGSLRAAVLPYSVRCGGRGKPRAGKSVALGRKTVANHLLGEQQPNFRLSADDIEKLQFGWRMYLKPGTTVEAAYETTMGVFYYSHFEERNGEPLPQLLPRAERPSIRQFSYHGPRQKNGTTALRVQLSEREWLLKHRALDGLSPTGLRHIGAIGQADAATNDLHLVSVFDRTKIVGTCHWILIVDEFTTAIVGVHICWNVDAEAALLAVLNAASSKVEFCARYGVTVTDDEFPHAAFSTIRADRGEFFNHATLQKFEQINCALEYVQTGRADLKGAGEGGHHALHAKASHRLPGTTKGHPHERGEPNPALSACLNVYEFTAELLRAIVLHNTVETIEHRLSTEMIRDGITPTRMGIWRWAQQKGYVAHAGCHRDHLIVNLCPEGDAVVRANGVYLLYRGNESGSYEVVIDRLRYLGAVAEQHGWLEQARRRGHFRIRVRYNPFDLRTIWYLDSELGLQELQLITNDPMLGEVANLRELVLAETLLSKTSRDLKQGVGLQARSDAAVTRKAMIDQAQAEKNAPVQHLTKKPSKRALLANRRDNRAEEVAATQNAPMRNPGDSKRGVSIDSRKGEIPPLPSPVSIDTSDLAVQAITAWLDEGDVS